MDYNLKLTLAPEAATLSDIISVIADELTSMLILGFGTRAACDLSEATSFRDCLDVDPNDLTKGCGQPVAGHYITREAIDSCKSWARDVSAFYNADLLGSTVTELLDDKFQTGFTLTSLDELRAELLALDGLIAIARNTQRAEGSIRAA